MEVLRFKALINWACI